MSVQSQAFVSAGTPAFGCLCCIAGTWSHMGMLSLTARYISQKECHNLPWRCASARGHCPAGISWQSQAELQGRVPQSHPITCEQLQSSLSILVLEGRPKQTCMLAEVTTHALILAIVNTCVKIAVAPTIMYSHIALQQ